MARSPIPFVLPDGRTAQVFENGDLAIRDPRTDRKSFYPVGSNIPNNILSGIQSSDTFRAFDDASNLWRPRTIRIIGEGGESRPANVPPDDTRLGGNPNEVRAIPPTRRTREVPSLNPSSLGQMPIQPSSENNNNSFEHPSSISDQPQPNTTQHELLESRLGSDPTVARSIAIPEPQQRIINPRLQSLTDSISLVGPQEVNSYLYPGFSYGRATGETIAAAGETLAGGPAGPLFDLIAGYLVTLSNIHDNYDVMARITGFAAALSDFYDNNYEISENSGWSDFDFDSLSNLNNPIRQRSAALIVATSHNESIVIGRLIGRYYIEHRVRGMPIDTMFREFFTSHLANPNNPSFRMRFSIGTRLTRIDSQNQHENALELIRELRMAHSFQGRRGTVFDSIRSLALGERLTPASAATRLRQEAGITASSSFVSEVAIAVLPELVIRMVGRLGSKIAKLMSPATSRLQFHDEMSEILDDFFVSTGRPLMRSMDDEFESLLNTLYRMRGANAEHFRSILSETISDFVRIPKLIRTPDNFAELFKINKGIRSIKSLSSLAERRSLELLAGDPVVQEIRLIRQGNTRSPDFIVRTQSQGIVSWRRVEVTSVKITGATVQDIARRIRRSVKRKVFHGQLTTRVLGLEFAQSGWVAVRLPNDLPPFPMNFQSIAQSLFNEFKPHQPALGGVRIYVGDSLVGFGH